MTTAAQKIPQPLLERLRLPVYPIAEGARMAEAKPQTMSRWFRSGKPVIQGKNRGVALSYLQLVEGAFVASFRSTGVSLQRIRKARDYFAEVFAVEFPFAQLELKTEGVHILKELQAAEKGAGPLFIVADLAGQEAWPDLISDRFDQFEYYGGIAMRWYPRGRGVPIVVDPQTSFGAPTLENAGVATRMLANRFRAGETLEEIEDDFGIEHDSLRAALNFEGVLPTVA